MALTLFAHRDDFQSLPIVSEHHEALPIGHPLLAPSVHSILSPGAFILSGIGHIERTSPVTLAILVLSDVLDEVGILRYAHTSHLVHLEHALIVEAIFK